MIATSSRAVAAVSTRSPVSPNRGRRRLGRGILEGSRLGVVIVQGGCTEAKAPVPPMRETPAPGNGQRQVVIFAITDLLCATIAAGSGGKPRSGPNAWPVGPMA